MPAHPGMRLHFPPFHLRMDVDLLYRGDEVVDLEPQAVRVLRYLVEHHDRVVPKRELHDAIWADVFTTDSVLKKAVYQARRALGATSAGTGGVIRTYHSRGYQFVAPVTIGAEPAPDAAAGAAAFRGPDYDQLVGRDSELAALRSELAAAAGGKGRPILLTGMPGIGKTQLAHHFVRDARAAGAVCLEARFFDYPASTLAPFETFTDLLRAALRVEGRGLDDLREAIRKILGGTLPRELGSVPADGTRAQRSGGEIFRAVVPIADCFVRLSRSAPLVLVLDDLQWADDASLEVIGYLLRTATEERLMIVGLVRSGEAEPGSPFESWLERQARYRTCTTITLSPLGESALGECMLRIFGGEANAPRIPELEFRQIAAASGGNPYFFTEMLRVLTAEGAIRPVGGDAPGRWEWAGADGVRLPESLVTAARERLGRLSSAVLELIEEAAVIGEEFRFVTLAAMSGREPADVERLCAEAVTCGVLVDTNVAPTDDRKFLHAILRRVVYDGLAHHRRAALHARAGEAIERIYAGELDRVAGVIADHYGRAGRAADARGWSLRAARVAANRWEWRDVVTNLERARASLEQEPGAFDPRQRIALEADLGEACLALGRLADAERLLAGATAIAEESGHHGELAAALLKLGQTRIGLSEYREALRATEKSHALHASMGCAEGVQRSLLQIGTIEVAMGRYDAAVPAIESVLASAPEESEIAGLARGLLGWARGIQGRFDESVPLLRRAIRDADRLGDARRRAVLLRRLHWVELSRGELEAAVRLALRARDASRSVGDAAAEAKCTMALGHARIEQGLWREGLGFLQETLDSLATIGDRHCEAETLWLVGRAHLETGAVGQARGCLETALRTILDVGDRDDEFRIRTTLGDSLRAAGELDAAMEQCCDAEGIAAELANEVGAAGALVRRARVALAAGDARAAEDAAGRAADTLERSGATESWLAWWALAEARTARGRLDAALDAMTRAMAHLDRIRGQLDAGDRARRDAMTAARHPQASALARLLRRMGRDAECAEIEESWNLPPGGTGEASGENEECLALPGR